MARKKREEKPIIIEEQPYYIYAKNVIEGKIIAGELVKLACRRFLSDLERDDLIFNARQIDKAIKFIGLFRHFKGDFNNVPFKMSDFQTFIFANIVGFTYKDTGERRFKQSYIQMSRKGGKTALTAALSLYYLIADGIASPSIAFCGASRDQASIAFDFVTKWARQLDPSAKDIKIYRNEIRLGINNGRMKVYSSDVKGGIEGGQFDFAIVDEYHSHQDSKVFDSVKGGMIGSKAHLSVITTAGLDLTVPCYEMRSSCVNMLHGITPNDRMFALIFELDSDDDYHNEDVWPKCQPNLGVTCPVAFMRSQIESAEANPSEFVSVMTKNLNIWYKTAGVWIPEKYLYQCATEIDFKDFKECECFMGIDLASVSDLTACSYLMIKDEELYLKTEYYLPSLTLEVSPNKEKYKQWVKDGYLKLTEGNVTDYDIALGDILDKNRYLRIQKIGFDKYNSTQFQLNAESQGLSGKMTAFSQSLFNFNKPTRELERRILSNTIKIDKNPINFWCVSNAIIKTDYNNNIKPVKGNNLMKATKDNKIDGLISMIMALGTFLDTPRWSGSIFVI